MRADWKSYVTICVILAAGTVAAYWTVWECDFISLDDAEYVYKNRQVMRGLSGTGWRYAWTSWDCSNWHPLTWLSLELDGSIGGANPRGFHVTNLLFHVLNSVLLFAVLFKLTNCKIRSAYVAALFALHPLHVESVAWISERKDVLSTLFLLLTIAAYLRYASRPSVLRYLLVMTLFVLGLLAKPMLVTLPILLLLLDIWPLRRVVWGKPNPRAVQYPQRAPFSLFVEKLPLLILAFADGLMTVAAQFGAVKLMTDVTWGTRIANLFNAYLWYLEKTFVPIHLTIIYPHPERDLSWSRICIGAFVFCGISGWSFWHRKDKPYLAMGWLWFVISLLPVIGLIQVGMQAYADRYAYIPHIGLFIAIVWEIHELLLKRKAPRIIWPTIVLASCIACGVQTHTQIGYWRNSDAIWSHAIALNPNNGFAHAHLADVFFNRKEYEQAIIHMDAGLRSKRSGYASNAYCNWGLSLLALNRPQEAEQKLRAALEADPYHVRALKELAKLVKEQGRESEAAKFSSQLTEAMDRSVGKLREDVKEQFKLGAQQAKQGNAKQAAVHFERAVQLAPESPEAHFNLAMTQRQLKLYKDAKSHFARALDLNPDLANAHFCLAEILESEKDFAEAKQHLEEALRLAPNDARVKQRLDRLAKQ